jgi:hypothetical protein
MTKARVNADNASADIQGVTAGTGLTGGGTSGTVTLDVNTSVIQARVANVTDTEIGYLDGVTSAIQTQLDAKAVYPSQTGNNGKYLTTDGTSTSWGTVSGGGYTLLASGSLSGSGGSISSISQSYRDLILIFRDWYTSSNPDRPMFGFNTDLGEYYTTFGSYSSQTNTDSYIDSTSWRAPNSNQTNFWMIQVFDYANTTTSKRYQIQYLSREYTNTSYYNAGTMMGGSRPTTAVSRLRWDTQSGNSFSGGTYELYGVK